jgi:hypothetical protein
MLRKTVYTWSLLGLEICFHMLDPVSIASPAIATNSVALCKLYIKARGGKFTRQTASELVSLSNACVVLNLKEKITLRSQQFKMQQRHPLQHNYAQNARPTLRSVYPPLIPWPALPSVPRQSQMWLISRQEGEETNLSLQRLKNDVERVSHACVTKLLVNSRMGGRCQRSRGLHPVYLVS